MSLEPLPYREERGRRWLQLFLFLGFLISLFIGVGALAALFFLEEEPSLPPPLFVEPRSLLEPDRIPPRLALLQLSGADPNALLRQAVNAGEAPLAYAILLLDGDIHDLRRATDALRLGNLFLSAGEEERAAAAFALARTVAVASPRLAGSDRGRILAGAARGLLSSQVEKAALDAALQAQHVAVQAPALLPAQRAEILSDIEPIVIEHGSAKEQQILVDLLRSPVISPQRIALESRLDDLVQPYAREPIVSQAVALRREAADRLRERIEVSGGVDFEAEREALGQALIQEDRTRSESYLRQLAGALDLTQRHALIQEQRAWLITKLRIAIGGYGIRLVPEWEGQIPQVEQALGRLTTELVTVLNEQVQLQEAGSVRDALRLEVLQWLAYQSDLGYFPGAPLGELSEEIEASQLSLEQIGIPPAFPLFFDRSVQPPAFRIARRYG